MRFGSSLLLALAMMLITQFAFPQGEEQKRSDSETQVAAARCAYTQDETCRPGPSATTDRARENGIALAQLPGRMPGPPRRVRPGMGYPPPPYRRWQREVSGAHVAIGAGIGLAFGALVGSKGGAKAAFGFGILGSGLGAAIGAGIPPMPPRGYRSWSDYDDEQAVRIKSRPPRQRKPRSLGSGKVVDAVPQAKR